MFNFVQISILKMRTQIKNFNISLFETKYNISFQSRLSSFATFLICCPDMLLRISFGARHVELQFRATKWLNLLLNDIKPQHFHFYFWIVSQLPQNDLVSHMETYKNRRAQVLLDVFTLILLQLDQVYKIAFNLAKIIDFWFQIHPFSLVRAWNLQFILFNALSPTYYLELIRSQYT